MSRYLKRIAAVSATVAGITAAFAFSLSGCDKKDNSEIAYISAVNAVSPVMPEEDMELLYNRDFFFDRLGYNEQKIYIKMLRACRNMEDMTYFDSVAEDTFLKAEYALFADHPEITWRWSYSGNVTGTVDTVYFDITDDEKKTRNREAISKADEIYEQIDPGLPDYEKMLAFYDTIIDETDYSENDHDQDMTSIFLDKNSVCAGYSRAFQYLCKKAGIECAYIEGTAYGFQDEDREAHAWNLVKLDDKYYWVDVTWGDPLSEDEKYNKTYSYFCSDDGEFLQTHEPDPTVWLNDGKGNATTPVYTFEIPECYDDSEDYYKTTGAYFEDYNRSELGEFIAEKLERDAESVIEFKMGDHSGYSSAINDLFGDRAYIYDIIENNLGYGAAESRDVYYLQDENTLVISLYLD